MANLAFVWIDVTVMHIRVNGEIRRRRKTFRTLTANVFPILRVGVQNVHFH